MDQKLQQVNIALKRRVAELERANRLLQKERGGSTSLYRTVVGTISYGITEIDTTGRILYANPAFHRMFEFEEGELLGESIVDLKATDALRESTKNYLAMIFEERPEPRPYMAQNRTKKGRVIDVQVDWSYRYGQEGEIIGLISIVTDITERIKAESALKASGTKYQDLYDNAPDMFISVDAKTANIIECNQTFLDNLGYLKEEVIGQAISMIYPPVKRDWIRKNVFKKFSTTGQVKNAEVVVQKKDGSRLEAILNVSAVKDKSGNIISSRSILRDITERQSLKEQLQKAQKMESLGTMASGITHDFNNILSSIIGFTEIALHDQLPEDTPAKYPLEQVLLASKRAKEVIKQILTFSRGHKAEKEPLDLHMSVRETLQLLQASCPDNITIAEQIPADPVMVLSAPSLLQQLQLNLYTNAIQAMAGCGGLLEVGLSTVEITGLRDQDNGNFLDIDLGLPSGTYVKLSVKDTGRGIDPAIINRIFDPYFTTRHKEDGTGLGLAIVHGIVEELHGEITVESVLGDGTMFILLLPVCPEQPLPGMKRDD